MEQYQHERNRNGTGTKSENGTGTKNKNGTGTKNENGTGTKNSVPEQCSESQGMYRESALVLLEFRQISEIES